MSGLLDIKLIIDKDWPKLTVYIKSKKRDADVEGIIAALQSYSDRRDPMIPAFYRESMVMVPESRIIRLFVANRKVMLQTKDRQYEVKKTLSEMEEVLDKTAFVRISQSEIINVKRVKKFDFSVSGTIGVELENGESTYVARRRIKNLKEILSGGKND